MILLDTTGKSLEVATSTTSAVDYVCAYIDHSSSGAAPGCSQGAIASATTTTVVAAPGASTQRQLKTATFRNKGSASQLLTVKLDVSATEYVIVTATLLPNQTLSYEDGLGWQVLQSSGAVRVENPSGSGITGQPASFYKVGTAPEAAGQFYSWNKDSGSPGAWAPGTPGLAGRATDGTNTTDNGCLLIKNPSTGANYLTKFDAATTVACQANLWDVLWVNSGLVVTTTTAQTVNSVALPARDLNGATSGEGVFAAILVVAATTNAGAVTNTTMSYTNSNGTAGRTATIASFPITAAIGTVVLFLLQAGDKGIQSIQTVTLGTSYVTGTISVILFRPLAATSCALPNAGALGFTTCQPGVRLYNGTCALIFGMMSATTATTINGIAQVSER